MNTRTASCPSCGGTGQSGRFCTECGAAQAKARPAAGARWIAAGAAVVLLALLSAIFIPEGRARAAGAAAQVGAVPVSQAGAGVPPDIGSMTPRERFDRLYARALQASQSGDDAGAAQFTPMALAAYRMLDSADPDARYHAALLYLHSGSVAPARLLADTILANDPEHLFGYLIRATAARWERDDRALLDSYRDFMAHEGAENARGREEYDAHRATLEETRRLAREALAGAP